jgi:putative PIN family toxin of toxin-antitoxin system
MSLITAVFDTNTCLQAVLSEKGPAMACVQTVLDGKVQLITTNEIVAELRGVLARPRLRLKYLQLSSQRTSSLIDTLLERASLQGHPLRNFPFDRDPADEVFINLAIESCASCLVTWDRDLSSRFPDLKIVTPVGFLEIVRAA